MSSGADRRATGTEGYSLVMLLGASVILLGLLLMSTKDTKREGRANCNLVSICTEQKL